MHNEPHLNANPLPLILLPGMGADERMFDPLRSALPQLITPRWISPKPNESLPNYARRFAAELDPGAPFQIGGASFGGVVALEVAAILKPQTCFLLGSIRSPKAMPLRWKLLRPAIPLLHLLPLSQSLLPTIAKVFRSPHVRSIATQLIETDPQFLSWAARAILSWQPSPETASVTIRQLHGDRDHIFPVYLAQPDLAIRQAGHLISISHPTETISFINAYDRHR